MDSSSSRGGSSSSPAPPQVVLVHMNRHNVVPCRWCQQQTMPADAQRCCRDARLAAFPRLSRLSDEQFREVQFVVLLRSLPKALLAYKFLAPNTEEWKQAGRREAGLLASQPFVGERFDESNLRFPPRHTWLWLVPLSLLSLSLSMLLWVLLMDRSPPQPIASADPFKISYPFPLNGSFEVVADDSKRSAATLHSDCIVMLGAATWASMLLAIVALVDLGQTVCVCLARCCWMRKPRRRYDRLLAAPVHFVTLYNRVLPAEGGMPSGELELDSALREQHAQAAFAALQSTAVRVLGVPLRCCGGFEVCYVRIRKWTLFGMSIGIGAGCGTGLMAFISAAGASLTPNPPPTERHPPFTCLPLRPFVVSDYAPMMNETESVHFQLHPCSAVTLWADFEVRVDNTTTMMQWPCVAPLPTAECVVLWILGGMATAMFLASIIGLFLLCVIIARRRFNQ